MFICLDTDNSIMFSSYPFKTLEEIRMKLVGGENGRSKYLYSEEVTIYELVPHKKAKVQLRIEDV